MSQLEEIRQVVGISVREFEAGLEALVGADPPYLELQLAGGWSKERAGGGMVDSISERARRELGAWPTASGLLEELVAALLKEAEAEPEPERKSRLQATAAVLGGMARDIAVNVISARIGQLG